MSQPTFAQAERRSILVPILIAILALGLVAAVTRHFLAAHKITLEHQRTHILPTSTIFKANSIVLGQNETDHTTFIATTVKVTNALTMKVYVEDFSLTLTDTTGAELTVKGLQKQEVTSVEEAFPKLRPLVGALLARETAIEAGSSAEGTVVFSLRVPESVWAARKSAVVQVDLYHQPSVAITIPKA